MFLSIRDAHTRHVQGDGLISSHAQTLQALGLDAIEVWLDPDGTLRYWQRPDGSPWSLGAPEQAQQFASELQSHGIRAASLCLPTDFAAHPEHVEWAANAVLLAQAMGAISVRIDTATQAKGLAADEVRDRFCRSIEQVLGATSESRMPLGIENHGHISNDPAFLDAIFARVGDERLGLTLDAGNFYWFGLPLDEVYAVCEHFAPRARHTHFKNIAYSIELQNEPRPPGHRYAECAAPLGRGDLDVARLVQILNGAGYMGDLCIENESLGHFEASERLQVLAEDAACLRAALA